jgi:hypothetical protein
MKVRVIQTTDGFYESEYYDDNTRFPSWKGTHRNNNLNIQNRFKTIEQAIDECKWFAENHQTFKVVYQEEL